MPNENSVVIRTGYTWDAESRMTEANDGTNPESFVYAGDGQRRKKSTSTGDINYLWDEENVLEELDGSNALIAHYTDFPGYWGGLSSLTLPSLSSAPQMAGMGAFNAVQFNQATFNQDNEEVETESHYYLFDLQSSNRLLLDGNAATDNEYLYQAYGEKVLSTGIIRNPFQFQGQVGPYYDDNNRIWMRARIYNPITGRWDSKDPVGYSGGNWNMYVFVNNGPNTYIDPLGLVSDCNSTCGPDITENLKTVIIKIKRDFYVKTQAVVGPTKSSPKRKKSKNTSKVDPWSTRRTACYNIANPLKAKDSWDITDLITYEVTRKGCGPGKCYGTATVNGTCHDQGDINYVAYGVMNSLCYWLTQSFLFSEKSMMARVSTWKFAKGTLGHIGIGEGNRPEEANAAKSWAKAGYLGWPRFSTPASTKIDCAPNCKEKYRNDSTFQFDYNWPPIK